MKSVLITAADTAGRFTSVDQQFYIMFTPRNAASGSIDYVSPIGGRAAKLKFHFDGNYSLAAIGVATRS